MKTNPLTTCETTATSIIYTKSRLVKNVAIMSIGVLFLFTACDGLTVLQSTMNSEQGVGVISQAVIYICYCVSSLVFPKYVIKKLGSKLTYALSMLTYIPYIASNFYPHWSLMIPTSILLGLGAPLLWGSQDIYLNDVSVLYAELLTAEDSMDSQIRNDDVDKEDNGQSASRGSTENCVSVDSKEEDNQAEKDCRCISYINIERGCVAYQSENCDEKYQEVNVNATPSSEDSAPLHPKGHTLSSECRSFCQHKSTENFVSDSRVTSSSTIRGGLNRRNSKVRSEVATRNKRSNALDSTTVPSSLDFNQIPDKYSKSNRTSSNSRCQIEIDYRTKVLESTTARFFGIHGLIYLSSRLWSNLLSYYVLRGDEHDYGMVRNSSCKCGADFCNAESATCLDQKMLLPSEATRYLLTGICVCVAVISVVVVFLFLDPVELKKEEDVSFSLNLVAATFKLAKRTELLLLMPASFYIGMTQGFYEGEFNKSFVGCAWGRTSQVALIAICYGIMCANSSFTSGWAVRLAGRPVIFTISALLNAAACIVLLKWAPDPSQPSVFFVVAGMWGCYVGTVWSQLRGFYGVLFKEDKEAAFATFHMWYSLGFCLSFAYTNFLCTSLKIYVLLAVSTVGFAGYFNIERRHANNEIK